VPEDSVAGSGGRPESATPRARSNRTVTPAVAAALLVLAASFALSVAFVLANGGLNLPAAAQHPAGSSAGAADVPTPSATDTVDGSIAPTGSPSPIASPTPLPSPTPATPTPSTSAAPSTAPTPRPSSNRYDLLTACPNTPDCWIYVVRQGDNLFSIAKYFGVPIQVVEDRNPWTRTTSLVAGQKLLLPSPTR
jgi:LysM repeat protein